MEHLSTAPSVSVTIGHDTRQYFAFVRRADNAPELGPGAEPEFVQQTFSGRVDTWGPGKFFEVWTGVP